MPSHDLLVLSATQLDALAEIGAAAARAAIAEEVAKLRQQAGHLQLPGSSLSESSAPPPPTPQPAPSAPPVVLPAPVQEESRGGSGDSEAGSNRDAPSGKKYVIRKGGTVRYGDVVMNEVPEEEFNVGEIWERLQSVMDVESGRGAELFRRAIRRDSRFKQVSTGRYRKVHHGGDSGAPVDDGTLDLD